MLKNNEKGIFSIIDGIFAITLIFIVFLLFNYMIDFQHDYSGYTNDFKDSQDYMELLSNKINFEDKSILEKSENILKNNNNSKKSIDEVSCLINESFNDLQIESNFLFTETNYLKSYPILQSGNINDAQNISVAIRNIGDYSFVLYIW
ncbi:MAG: hypothetical protein KO202_02105 [Methanobacteriaceae archaeon]|jgi:hypothetical protein|nr:hypothetical protein [Methanobacteriaceae archaeon]